MFKPPPKVSLSLQQKFQTGTIEKHELENLYKQSKEDKDEYQSIIRDWGRQMSPEAVKKVGEMLYKIDINSNSDNVPFRGNTLAREFALFHFARELGNKYDPFVKETLKSLKDLWATNEKSQANIPAQYDMSGKKIKTMMEMKINLNYDDLTNLIQPLYASLEGAIKTAGADVNEQKKVFGRFLEYNIIMQSFKEGVKTPEDQQKISTTNLKLDNGVVDQLFNDYKKIENEKKNVMQPAQPKSTFTKEAPKEEWRGRMKPK